METNDTTWRSEGPQGTADGREIQSALPIDIEHMSPAAVVEFYRQATSDDSPLDELNEAMDEALERLPQINVRQAGSVYAAFADSPDDSDRRTAVRFIDCLTAVDYHTGMRIWHQLARDPDGRVRFGVYDTLADALGDKTNEDMDQGLARLGLTPHDACRLLLAYVAAEHGHGLHELASRATPTKPGSASD
jgi:hypothetical protein